MGDCVSRVQRPRLVDQYIVGVSDATPTECDNECSTRSWGVPTGTTVAKYSNDDDLPQGMWHVPFWRLLCVDVYVRDFVGRFHRGQKNHEWRFYASYWVKEWEQVESFYDRFYSVGWDLRACVLPY